MKKRLVQISCGLAATILLAALIGCGNAAPRAGETETGGTTPTGQAGQGGSGSGTAGEKPSLPTAEEQGQQVLKALEAKDMAKLAQLAHPDKGVRFSPYGYIDSEQDRILKPEAISKSWKDDTVYRWGTFDGSGEPIQLKFSDYYAKFIYDADFAQAPHTGVNETIGKGNTLNNIKEVYPSPQHTFVEYHFSGFDPKFEGMDWKSLRLVFEKTEKALYLVGIVHDQWTI